MVIRAGAPALGVDVRIGVHTGEVELRPGGDIAGIAVHAAARITAVSGPGEITVSEALPTLVAGSGFTFADRATHRLKGVPGEWRLFELTR